MAKKPGRKTKCLDCGDYIYVRTRPRDRAKILIREDQIDAVEEQWAIERGSHAEYLAGKREFERARANLRAELGREPSNSDVQWGLLSKECREHAAAANWGLYRNARFQMAEVLRKEGRTERALQFFLWVCYLDLNGPNNLGGLNDPELLRQFPPFSTDTAFLAPGVLSILRRVITDLELDEPAILAIFLDIADREFAGLRLPVEPASAWETIRKELFKK